MTTRVAGREESPPAERLLRSVIDALDGRMCIVGVDGTILDGNRRWTQALEAHGLDPRTAAGRQSVFDLLDRLAPAVSEQIADIVREVIQDPRCGEGDRSLKYRLLSGVRSEWWVVRIHPVLDDHGARAVISMVDITQGMRTQEELQRITAEAQSLAAALAEEKSLLAGVLSSIPHMVYWKNDALRYAGVNAAFRSMRRLPPEAGLDGRDEAGLAALLGVDGDSLTAVLQDIEPRVLASGQPAATLPVELPDGEGGTRIVLLSVLPHVGDGPTKPVLGVIGVGADVTHVTALERQLAQANRLESIGQLAAGVAHEINTPVQYVSDNTRFLTDEFAGLLEGVQRIAGLVRAAPTGVAGDQCQAVEVMAQVRAVIDRIDLDFLAEEVPGALSQSLEGLNRVAEIVRALKDFSHPGQDRTYADLNRAVQTAVELSRGEWKYVAALHLDLDPAIGVVPCYETELKQVLLNILVNAAQAIQQVGADPSTGRIRVRTRRDGDTVTIEVQDNGPGMDEQTRQRIFDPFFTTKEVGRGTGQGLSLAWASIVTKHGGTLRVDSSPGAGAVFEIRLPASSTGSGNAVAGSQIPET